MLHSVCGGLIDAALVIVASVLDFLMYAVLALNISMIMMSNIPKTAKSYFALRALYVEFVVVGFREEVVELAKRVELRATMKSSYPICFCLFKKKTTIEQKKKFKPKNIVVGLSRCTIR